MISILDSALTCAVLFFTPALAFRPQLLSSPWTAISVPICSIFVLAISLMPLVELNVLDHGAVRDCLYGLALLGLGRTVFYFRGHGAVPSMWSRDDTFALLMAAGFAIFFAGRLSLFGFDNNDEIYSWNKWAVDFYLDKNISFQFTKWAYPLLFPRMLSLGYIFNGTLEAQTAVKTALAIFPFCAMAAIGLGSASQIKSRSALTALLLALIAFGAGAKSIYDDGMPDTLAATAVVISALILFERQRLSMSKAGLYSLVALLGSAAVLTKQPSLVWALFTLPILVASPSLMGAQRSKETLLLLIPALVAAIWWLTEGAGFHLNEGPVTRSMENRDLLEQSVNSARLLFTEYIEVSLVLGWMIFAVLRNGRAVSLSILFILPSVGFWLMFANYDLRAGLPALLVSGLLITLNNFGIRESQTESDVGSEKKSFVVTGVICFALVIGASLKVVLDAQKTAKRNAGYEYGDVAINNYFRIFGSDAPIVREQIRDNEEAVLWTPTHYVYGLFYGYREVHFPSYKSGWKKTDLIAELRDTRATHATNSGDMPYGPGGRVFESILFDHCGSAFHKLNKSENRYGIAIFRIDKLTLNSTACDY